MNTSDTRAIILPRLMQVPDVAVALGLSQATVRSYLKSGAIPGRRFGRRWIVSRELLVQMVEDGEPRSPTLLADAPA